MSTSQYVRPIKNGDALYHLSALWPLLLWGVFGFKLFSIMRNLKVNDVYMRSLSTIVLTVAIYLLPVVLAGNVLWKAEQSPEGHLEKEHKPFEVASMPPGFGFCMNTKVTSEEKRKGIIGKWDYSCEGMNEQLISRRTSSITTRFYYVNYAIFLLVITVYNAFTRIEIFKNPFIILNIRFALLLGVVGCMLSVFTEFYLRSMWMGKVWSHFLAMNCSCLLLIGLSILTGMTSISRSTPRS